MAAERSNVMGLGRDGVLLGAIDTRRNERVAPRVSFGAIRLGPNGEYHIASVNGSRNTATVKDRAAVIPTLLSSGEKMVAAGIAGVNGYERDLRRSLWLTEDVVPVNVADASVDPTALAEQVSHRFTRNGIETVDINPHTREVTPLRLVTLADYEATTLAEDMDMLRHFAERLGATRIVHLTSTAQGGGVALMRHDEVRFKNTVNEEAVLAGSDAPPLNISWHVTVSDINPEVDSQHAGKDPFLVTKQIHNTIQGVSDKTLTPENEEVYDAWTKTNAKELAEVISQPDAVFVVEDPQPARLIKYIRAANPDALIIYRSHIQIQGTLATEEGTPQNSVWNFMRGNLVDDTGNGVNLFVAHPSKDSSIGEFVPQGPNGVDLDTVVYRTAATSPIDGLNKELSPEQTAYYTDMFNDHLIVTGQTPLDPERESLAQIARFDPSKNIPGVIETYRLLRERMKTEGIPDDQTPQLIIAGHGAKDDPDGVRLLEETMSLRLDPRYAHLADDIKVARLPHNDQMLNVIARRSKVGMQISVAEGCEVKVTEWKMKGKPVIGSNRGGIPRQINDGVDGFVFEPTDYAQMADRLFTLFTDSTIYSRMSQAAKDNASPEYMTVANVRDWIFLAAMLKEGKDMRATIRQMREKLGRNPFVKELLVAEYAKATKPVSVDLEPGVEYLIKTGVQ